MKLHSELLHPNAPINLYEDNQSSIKTAEDVIFSDRSKHIAVRFHYIRELVKNGEISLKYCSSSDMLADALTKPLKRIQHAKLTTAMGIKI